MDATTDQFYKICGWPEPGETIRSFEGATFEKQVLDRFDLMPIRPGCQTILKNCCFVRCKFGPIEFGVYEGVYLQNIVFDSIQNSGIAQISSKAILDHVVFRGKQRSGGLWVRDDTWGNEENRQYVEFAQSQIDLMLDISEYHAREIVVSGLPIHKIRYNPDTQLVFKRQWFNRVDWKSPGMPRLGWFFILAKKYTEAVLQKPAQKEKFYPLYQSELECFQRENSVEPEFFSTNSL